VSGPRRQASPGPRGVGLLRAIFVVVGLCGLGLIAGGVTSIVHKESGEATRATVTDCQKVIGQHTTFECNGSWVEGGDLVGGNGHVVLGNIDDATPSDVGKTIDVRVSGDHAYTPSLRVPIILLVLGVLIAGASVAVAIGAGRQPATRRART
jgi:hypothetical protein